MTATLLIGDYAHSSWSLRGWLLFRRFGIPADVELAPLYQDSFRAALARFAPARTVPAVRFADGTVVADSLAIAEELASRHPDAGLWPEASEARAAARMLAAEMHAGFHALREDCPMNLRAAYAEAPVSAAVRADLDRIEALWDHARAVSGAEEGWLFGRYSAADAFYAPVAARIAGYGLPVSERARAYVARHLADGAFRRWRALGLVLGPHQGVYDRPYAQTAWPGPAPLPARAVEAGQPVNDSCPYSGEAITHLLDFEGRIYGFCNATCRDKTVADPAAWPGFRALAGLPDPER